MRPKKRKPKIDLPERIRAAFVEFGRLGGRARKGSGRWKNLSPDERTKLGRQLARTRWKGRKKK